MTDSIVEVMDAVVALLEDGPVEFKDVFYGEEALIPRTPAASVAPDGKERELSGTGHQTLNTFGLTINIYHAKLGSTGVTRRECDVMAEQIEALLHQNRNLGGLVINGFVTSMASGYLRPVKERSLFVGTQINWEGISKTRIGV